MDDELDDVVDQLASHNPAPWEHYEALGRTPRAQALLEQIMAGGRLQRWWRRPRFVIPVALLAVVGATTATYQATRAPSVAATFVCYRSTDLTGSRTPVPASGAGPVAGCATAWRDGEVGRSRSVPSLVACEFGSGLVCVFPGASESVCAALGLEPARRLTPLETRESRLDVDLSRIASRPGCLGLSVAAADARTELRALSLEGWHVELLVRRSSQMRPCASYAVATARRTVDIVPIAAP